MWYEILPAAGMIFSLMTLGMYGSGAICNLFIGKHYLRDLRHNVTYQDFLRDDRLTGSPFKLNGLEVIPDENETSGKSK